MNKDHIDKARADLIREFGDIRGSRISSIIIPNIMADFYKMAERAEPETEITEEYRIENSNAALHVTGHSVFRNGKRELVITAMELKNF